MNVNGVGQSSSVQKIVNSPIYREVPKADAARQGDRVELSGVSHLKGLLQKNDIRVDKVASIKAAIEAGTYETPDKMDVAVDRMLDDING